VTSEGELAIVGVVAGAILAFDVAFGVVSFPHDIYVFVTRCTEKRPYDELPGDVRAKIDRKEK